MCNEFATKFANKQGLVFNGWIADDVGGVAVFADQYYFNLSDIILDIIGKQPKGFILQWQDDGVEANINSKFISNINYKSYTMGLRYEQLK